MTLSMNKLIIMSNCVCETLGIRCALLMIAMRPHSGGSSVETRYNVSNRAVGDRGETSTAL